MAFFLYKLIPPRPTFALDMTDAERAVMGDHVRYWTAVAQRGNAIAFGPVADPKGSWGVAILEVAGIDEARGLSADDPAIRSERGFSSELSPMPVVVMRPPARSAAP